MNRVSFLGSLLAMVLAPLGLRAKPNPRSFLEYTRREVARKASTGFEEQLKFQRAKDALEARFRFDVEEWSFVEPVPDPNDFDWVSYPRG